MACFIVPVTETVVTTIAQGVLHSCESKAEKDGKELSVKFSEKLGLLNKMLWGGSALLVFEHIWHGEVVPFYPFLTAAESSEETSAMLHEMGTSGVAMALLVTAVWACVLCIGSAIKKKVKAEEMRQ